MKEINKQLQKNNTQCPFCHSINLQFVEKTSNPIFLDIKAYVFCIKTILQRKKQVLKCNNCNLEIKSKHKIFENKC